MAVIVYYGTFARSALDFQSYLTSSRSKSYLCSQNLQPTKSWFQLLATVKDIIKMFLHGDRRVSGQKLPKDFNLYYQAIMQQSQKTLFGETVTLRH
jgi:hypothetical protein